jgi:multiple sugar transport system substrate-binding protein
MSDTTQRPGQADFASVISRASSRREFLRGSGGALAGMSLIGALAACGSSGSGSNGEVILSLTSNLKDTVNQQANRFNDQHSGGPQISLRIMPEDTTQYFQQLRTQFQGGGTDISVIAGDVIWPSQLAEPGWISDLSDRFTKADQKPYLPGTIDAMVYQDRIWGVPWYTDAGLLYYRSDLLEQSGYSEPPTTWDELKEMAQKIMADSGVPNGLVFTGADYEGGTVLGTEFIRNAGGDILDGDTVVIGSPEAIEGLTTQQGLVTDGIAPEAVANMKEDEASGAFLRGDAAFMRMWPYAYDLLSDPEQSKLHPDQVGLSQVPVVTTGVDPVNVGGGWNFYINASAEDQEEAWEVVQFLSAPPQQKQMALELGLLPTRTELYSDPEILKQLPAVRLGGDAFEGTTTPPVSPYYSDMSLAMSKEFNANILGDTSPEDATASLQDQLETIIQKGG